MGILRRAALAGMLLVSVTGQARATEEQFEPIAIPEPPAGKAQMVFFRPGGFQGALISCAVSEGESKLSSLPPARYFVAVVEPGRHIYSVSAETKDRILYDLKPGQTEYAQCKIETGFFAGRPKLNPARDIDFKSKLTWKLAKSEGAGPGVLTEEQIKAALAAQSAPQTSVEVAPSAASPSAVAAPAPAPEPLQAAVPAPEAVPASEPAPAAPAQESSAQ